MEERTKKTLSLGQAVQLAHNHLKTIRKDSDFDLTAQSEYENHVRLINFLGENYLNREFRKFEIDDHNKKVLKFLLYYFNNCILAEDIFENEDYKLHKNIILVGEPGTGKTMLMQIFSDYLKITNNKERFLNLSVTQMMNYYKQNGHIDRYTYNEENGKDSFYGDPTTICLNDIGLEIENQKSYGTALDSVIDEFLYARYEIYQQHFVKYHLTSNLSVEDFLKRFEHRLVDRFKSFNVISLTGESRRK